MFLKGQYVRCPICLEKFDDVFPRNFILGKIIRINKNSNVVEIKIFDLKNSKNYYPHAFAQTVFPMQSVDRCGAAKDAPVVTPEGPGIVISRRLEKKPDAFYEYFVLLENGMIKSYKEDELDIEYTAADYMPIKQMLHYEFQNPTWYASRLPVSNNIHMINNTVYGFRSLAGCRVFLMPHQISTVVRAFESRPIRYMLADEVGLGKTIEASSIVKILSEENKQLRALYIVPASLIQQWQNELQYKFGINTSINIKDVGYTGHIIIALEDIASLIQVTTYVWDILIVDETHRLLFANKQYELVHELSKRIENTLFLSATPIQNRGKEYLKLLALLNPSRYDNMTLPKFLELVSKQERIQNRVNSIYVNMSKYSYYKEDSLDKLNELSEVLDDNNLKHMVKDISFASTDAGKSAMEIALAYVSENYRIERNVIRNRRASIHVSIGKRKIIELPYNMSNAQGLYCEGSVYVELLEYIKDHIDDNTIRADDIFNLLQGAFSSPWALMKVVKDMGVTDFRLLSLIELWLEQAENEVGKVNYLLDEEPDEIKGRLLYAIDYLEQNVTVSGDNNGKVVVFSEYPETLAKFGELLNMREITHVCFTANMAKKDLEDSVFEFQNNTEVRVILCDATGGEGRNFQNADWLIHLDLPWTANAIEQRIGRLDRLGRNDGHIDVCSVVLYSKDTIEEQLFKIWNEGLDVFKKSLSGLEILTTELNQLVEDAILGDIQNGLENALEEIIDLAEETSESVDDEILFDSTSTIYRQLTGNIEDMIKLYGSGDGSLFKSSMLKWGHQVGLHVTSTQPEVLEFVDTKFSPKAAIQSLYVPPDWNFYDNTTIMRRAGKITGTFDRATAIQKEDLLFYAPGDQVYDSIVFNAINSGRGRCCALAANAPFDFKGFICIYNVEPKVNYLLEKGIPARQLAQFRMYLPMKQIVVSVPIEKKYNVSDKELIDFIYEPKNLFNSKHLGRRSGLVSPLEQFKEQYPQGYWSELVNKANIIARKKATEKALDLADLEAAKHEIKRIVNGYISEYIYLNKSMKQIDNIQSKYEDIYTAISNPILTLDSIAILFLTRNQ